MDYLLGVLVWLSQGLNAVLLAGHPDMTVSARCHVNRHRTGWKHLRRVLNAAFFWQVDHCASSFASDVNYSRQILQLADNPQPSKLPKVEFHAHTSTHPRGSSADDRPV